MIDFNNIDWNSHEMAVYELTATASFAAFSLLKFTSIVKMIGQLFVSDAAYYRDKAAREAADLPKRH